jgi:hypothetical protein
MEVGNGENKTNLIYAGRVTKEFRKKRMHQGDNWPARNQQHSSRQSKPKIILTETSTSKPSIHLSWGDHDASSTQCKQMVLTSSTSRNGRRFYRNGDRMCLIKPSLLCGVGDGVYHIMPNSTIDHTHAM